MNGKQIVRLFYIVVMNALEYIYYHDKMKQETHQSQFFSAMQQLINELLYRII